MTRTFEESSDYADNRLVQLHVEIARRADQLAERQIGPRTREIDLQCWLEAEREVLESSCGATMPLAAS